MTDIKWGDLVQDRNLSLEEGAGRLGISPHTLRAWSVYQHKIPFLRMGRRILFKASDLDAFERKARVEAREA
jgi:excisionase family DNA binding protein